MPNIIQKLFGSGKNIDELTKLDENLRIALEDLKNLENDWREKVRIIKEFTDDYEKEFDLQRLKNYIRVVREIEIKYFGELKQERVSVLYIRHVVLSRNFSLANYARIKHIFEQQEKLWNQLEEVLKKQLEFIGKNTEEDIGVVKYKINEFIDLLREEAKLLGLERKMFKILAALDKKFDKIVNSNMIGSIRGKIRRLDNGNDEEIVVFRGSKSRIECRI